MFNSASMMKTQEEYKEREYYLSSADVYDELGKRTKFVASLLHRQMQTRLDSPEYAKLAIEIERLYDGIADLQRRSDALKKKDEDELEQLKKRNEEIDALLPNLGWYFSDSCKLEIESKSIKREIAKIEERLSILSSSSSSSSSDNSDKEEEKLDAPVREVEAVHDYSYSHLTSPHAVWHRGVGLPDPQYNEAITKLEHNLGLECKVLDPQRHLNVVEIVFYVPLPMKDPAMDCVLGFSVEYLKSVCKHSRGHGWFVPEEGTGIACSFFTHKNYDESLYDINRKTTRATDILRVVQHYFIRYGITDIEYAFWTQDTVPAKKNGTTVNAIEFFAGSVKSHRIIPKSLYTMTRLTIGELTCVQKCIEDNGEPSVVVRKGVCNNHSIVNLNTPHHPAALEPVRRICSVCNKNESICNVHCDHLTICHDCRMEYPLLKNIPEKYDTFTLLSENVHCPSCKKDYIIGWYPRHGWERADNIIKAEAEKAAKAEKATEATDNCRTS